MNPAELSLCLIRAHLHPQSCGPTEDIEKLLRCQELEAFAEKSRVATINVVVGAIGGAEQAAGRWRYNAHGKRNVQMSQLKLNLRFK